MADNRLGEFHVQGLDDLLAKMKQLPERVGNNAMRRSLRKGANVIKDVAAAKAKKFDDPVSDEAIYKNVAV